MRSKQCRRKHAAIDREQNREGIGRFQSTKTPKNYSNPEKVA
jgi:hypothetical protein